MSFFAELKRRKVIRVGIAYVIGAWLVLQLTEVLTELLSLPASIGPVVVAVVAIGLPIVLFLSWAFELTSDGLKRDSEVAPDQRSSGKVINVVVIGLLMVALGYFVWESRFQGEGAERQATAAPGADTTEGAEDVAPVPRSIAVLPFENFSTEKSDEYFADGLTDTLLHKLAQIQELKVIARNSTFQFKGTNKDVREIGKILDVETVLEGSVQRAGNQVRVIAQLVQTSDGAHLWSETFDDTMENIFALQDRIATSIVEQFELELSQAEQARLLRNGTRNPEAYDLVIRAQNYHFNTDEGVKTSEEDSEPIALLKQAVELDPEYAQAWAYLSRRYNGLAFASDSTADYERLVGLSQAAAEEALRLDDEIAQPHSALGWVMHRKDESLKAAQHFRRALELDPNYFDALSGLAIQISIRDPEESLRLLDRAAEIEPTASIIHRQKHFALNVLGRHEESLEELKKAIELEPTEGIYYNDLADLLEWMGRPDEGARYNSQLLQLSPGSHSGMLAMAEAWVAALEPQRAEAWLQLILNQREGSDRTKRLNTERLIAAAEFSAALEYLETIQSRDVREHQVIRLRLSSCMGLGQAECAAQQASQLRTELDQARQRGYAATEVEIFPTFGSILAQEMNDPDLDSSGSMPALMELVNNSRFIGSAFYLRAGILARMGDTDAAFEQLEWSLAQPGGAVFNIDFFMLPVEHSLLLSPLKEDQRFDDWLAEYQTHRDAMRDRMIEMEAMGQIIKPASVERMTSR